MTLHSVTLFRCSRFCAVFMQVQAQLLCTQARYCDFIVYTNESIHSQRIHPVTAFVEESVAKVKLFFQNGVLPELLGKWFSRPPPATTTDPNGLPTSSNAHVPNVKYCYCQDEEHGLMVACDNPNCHYQWFHLECLRLKSPPKSKRCMVLPRLSQEKHQEEIVIDVYPITYC